jgi:tRNA pseudouridine38-40 synthase
VREVRGASRTDAGVHARGQLVAFDTDAEIPPRGWVLGTGRHLPREIAVLRAARVAPGFIPRYANEGKRYAYRISASRVRDPFEEGRAWRVHGLRLEALLAAVRSEAEAALGTHDFVAFRSRGDERVDTTRTIRAFDAALESSAPDVARIEVEGNAFLYNMVRILVGTVVEVAQGRRAPGAIARALASRDRKDAGITAPAHGLYLERVFSPAVLGDAWPNGEPEDGASESDPQGS